MTSFPDTDTDLDYARGQWEDGEARLQHVATDSSRRATIEDVVDGIMVELERRIGQSFSSVELVRAYERSEAWCLELAHRVAPDHPWAWNLDVVQASAFHRFARRAQDYQA